MTAAQDLFWLTHYTYNTINPLVDEAKVIEPTIQLGVTAVFGHAQASHTKVQHVEVALHWRRDGMLELSGRLHNKAEVDRLADKLRAKIDTLESVSV